MEIIDVLNTKIQDRIIEIPNEIYKILDEDKAVHIKNFYDGKYFMKLPESEIAFFEWLKENDPEIWKDLWDESPIEPYCVSFDFLPYLIRHGNGFPICDLLNNENYYFTPIHINGREAELMVETIKQRFLNRDSLTPAQTLLMEISLNPIDIWHFSYKYNIEIYKAQVAVAQLVEDESIVHFKLAEHLANFIHI